MPDQGDAICREIQLPKHGLRRDLAINSLRKLVRAQVQLLQVRQHRKTAQAGDVVAVEVEHPKPRRTQELGKLLEAVQTLPNEHQRLRELGIRIRHLSRHHPPAAPLPRRAESRIRHFPIAACTMLPEDRGQQQARPAKPFRNGLRFLKWLERRKWRETPTGCAGRESGRGGNDGEASVKFRLSPFPCDFKRPGAAAADLTKLVPSRFCHEAFSTSQQGREAS
eukprot:scaffold1355_cov268-Pinguiococcus_pyrenoidosus.AAC.80